MASKKIYTVVKDGEELEQLKTLAAAKKLADTEGAEVYSDGKCVYQAAPNAVEEKVEKAEEKPTEAPVTEIVTAEPVVSRKPVQPEVEEPKSERYRLKALMNVRKTPSTNGEILGTRAEGSIVRVTGIEDGWLHLTDGTFILYEGGKWAEKLV